MNMLDVLTRTLTIFEETSKKVLTAYETHIRQKAIEVVNAKLEEKMIDRNTVPMDDYEAMVCDTCKDLKETHQKRFSQGLMVVMGIDFLVG